MLYRSILQRWPRWRNLTGGERHTPDAVAPAYLLSHVGTESSPIVSEPEAPPDGGYGWVCLGALFTINCFTWGVIAVS